MRRLPNKFARVNPGSEYEIIDPNGIKVLYLSLLQVRTHIPKVAWLT